MADIKCTRQFVDPAKIQSLQTLIQASENETYGHSCLVFHRKCIIQVLNNLITTYPPSEASSPL